MGTPIAVNCFLHVSNLMNKDLGVDEPDYSPNKICDKWRVFLYVIDKSRFVVGCCVVEELSPHRNSLNNYTFRRLKGGRKSLLSWQIENMDKIQSNPKTNNDTQDVSIDKPLCGIRRLWVSKDYRRRGIATTLLDAIIHSFFYGFTLRRTQIAFTEPTSNGADFAASYVGREDFFIY